MKQLAYIFFLLVLLSSCEQVIDVELNESDPRLVIEASFNLLEDGSANSMVKLTTTAPFFDEQIPYVTDAVVLVTSNNGGSFSFAYTEDGIYQSDLIPELGIDYTLEITYNNETYIAIQQLVETVSYEFIEQEDDGGFLGDEIELKAFFTDPGGIENHYFFEVLSERGNEYDTASDEFFDGNQIFALYFADDLDTGDEVIFNLYGVDEQFFNFMFVLLQQGSDDTGGPFETQPATVRGNIINTTNPDHFPLGYFRISEVSTLNYIVQ